MIRFGLFVWFLALCVDHSKQMATSNAIMPTKIPKPVTTSVKFVKEKSIIGLSLLRKYYTRIQLMDDLETCETITNAGTFDYVQDLVLHSDLLKSGSIYDLSVAKAKQIIKDEKERREFEMMECYKKMKPKVKVAEEKGYIQKLSTCSQEGWAEFEIFGQASLMYPGVTVKRLLPCYQEGEVMERNETEEDNGGREDTEETGGNVGVTGGKDKKERENEEEIGAKVKMEKKNQEEMEGKETKKDNK